MTISFLVSLTVLFGALFTLGFISCLPLYGWQVRRFVASRLFLKLAFWIPIYCIFGLTIFFGRTFAWYVTAVVVAQATREFISHEGWKYVWIASYWLLLCASMIFLPLYFYRTSHTQAGFELAAVGFGSVVSDICAFFAGSYVGRHYLPAFINAGKSYEGIVGQFVGGFLGLAIVALLPEIGFSWRLALIIGLASAAGDLSNSVAKRLLQIKDWGQAIPGHGGVMDRFASLAFALAAGYSYYKYL